MKRDILDFSGNFKLERCIETLKHFLHGNQDVDMQGFYVGTIHQWQIIVSKDKPFTEYTLILDADVTPYWQYQIDQHNLRKNKEQ